MFLKSAQTKTSKHPAHFINTHSIKTGSLSAASGRIVYLDVLRAFAILMMLQGHFIDTMLGDTFRDPNNSWYAAWAFMRGITAPVFFFSSGLVFTYLLSRTDKPWRENKRLFKGLTRVFQLLILGYLLRINFPALLGRFQLYPWFWGADVLHVIGLALLAVIILFILHKQSRLPLPLILSTAGLSVFYLEPSIQNMNWSGIPNGISGYFVNQGFSTFTIFPWIGYTLLGGTAGAVLARRPSMAHSPVLPFGLLIAGLLFHYYSIESLTGIYQWTGWAGIRAWRLENSHLLIRLGDVWVVMAGIIWITRFWKSMPSLIPKIGQETLLIYCVHYVVLFGTWFGIGIKLLGDRSLNPIEAVLGAILFLGAFVLMISRLELLEAAIIRSRRFLWEGSVYTVRNSWSIPQRLYSRAMPYLRLYRIKIRP